MNILASAPRKGLMVENLAFISGFPLTVISFSLRNYLTEILSIIMRRRLLRRLGKRLSIAGLGSFHQFFAGIPGLTDLFSGDIITGAELIKN